VFKTRDTAERRVDASSCGVEGALKGIGSTTKGGYRIIKCLFDIFNDLYGENQVAQGHREDQLEHTRIEGLVGVNHEDDDVIDKMSIWIWRVLSEVFVERAVGGIMDSRCL